MRITIPEKFARVLEEPDYINDCFNYYWTNKKKTLVPLMENRLIGLKEEYKHATKNTDIFNDHYSGGDLINKTGKFRSYLRLGAGYNMLFGTFTPSKLGFGLYSEGAYSLFINSKMKDVNGNKLTTEDHIFGTTDMGVRMFTTYRDSGWNLDFMVNEYVPENLYQYFVCTLLKGEHQKESKDDTKGVARGKHTLVEKTSLVHYKECNIALPLITHKTGIGN